MATKLWNEIWKRLRIGPRLMPRSVSLVPESISTTSTKEMSSELAPVFAEGIEVKVYSGDAALRRKLSRCNQVPVAKISSGLPLRERKDKMLKAKTIQSEQGLRELIQRNLRKEIHPGTKPSVDFIKKILDDAYESGMKYDVTDLRSRIVAFANNSSNQAATVFEGGQGDEVGVRRRRRDQGRSLHRRADGGSIR